MYIFQNTKDNKSYAIRSISYNYNYDYMTEDDILEMFADIVDCCWSPLINDEELLDMDTKSKIRYLKNDKYIVLEELKSGG